jgi:hypothetical protein
MTFRPPGGTAFTFQPFRHSASFSWFPGAIFAPYGAWPIPWIFWGGRYYPWWYAQPYMPASLYQQWLWEYGGPERWNPYLPADWSRGFADIPPRPVFVSEHIGQQQLVCNYCGDSPDTLALCADCENAYYCGTKCQAKDYPNHKMIDCTSSKSGN